jgi:hypothetical protein
MRVYLPSVTGTLRAVLARGGLRPPLFGCGVTADLRRAFPDADQEGLEYEALTHAARESLQLIAAEPDAAPRRTVIVIEAPDASVAADPGASRCAVRVAGAAELKDIVAVYVDDPAAEPAVAAAARALDAAEVGDAAAAAAVEALDDHELLWYATQEIPDLVG